MSAVPARGALGGSSKSRSSADVLAAHERESLLLLIGDVTVFYLSLWITLGLRHWDLPSIYLVQLHVVPFSFFFLVWIIVFFISGLYDQHTLLLKRRLPGIILRAQTINIALAAIFFMTPYFVITPKTVLLIYLGVSFALVVFWRLRLSQIMAIRRRQHALVIGSGSEVDDLVREINGNNRYNIRVVRRFPAEEVMLSDRIQSQIVRSIKHEGVSVIVADIHHENIKDLLPVIYHLLLLDVGLNFIDTSKLYQCIFARIPLSSLCHSWLLDSFRFGSRWTYDFLKRIFDLMVGAAAGAVMLCALPIVWAAVRLEDGGPLFIHQERVGEGNRPIQIVKFRTMTGSDQGSSALRSTLTVTKTGRFLRQTRLDELPQAWNLIRGDLSFIGPRPELPALAAEYARAIPYYTARHLIKPGLTGWAQIYHQEHPHHGIDVTETRKKLSYDLYYIKNRSFLLDLQIALKTIRTLLARSGA